MRLFINLGKFATGIAWLLMIYNLVLPLGGQMGLFLHCLLGLTLIMHLIQLAIFYRAVAAQAKVTGKDYLSVMIFGVFAVLTYRARLDKA